MIRRKRPAMVPTWVALALGHRAPSRLHAIEGHNVGRDVHLSDSRHPPILFAMIIGEVECVAIVGPCGAVHKPASLIRPAKFWRAPGSGRQERDSNDPFFQVVFRLVRLGIAARPASICDASSPAAHASMTLPCLRHIGQELSYRFWFREVWLSEVKRAASRDHAPIQPVLLPCQ